jgi:NAD(P)H-hydrate epimerase
VLVDLTEKFEHNGRVHGGAAERLLARAPHAVLLGPGLGDDARTRALLSLALATLEVPLVLDADALNALDGEPERLRGARVPLVLTPHPGEAARLLGRRVDAVLGDRESSVMELATKTGAVVVLKGAGTLVTDGERLYVNRTGNPGMATAGSGDVLTGVIASLLAQGMTTFDGAVLGVHLHGLAGDLAAAEVGEHGMIATDILDRLPAACAAHGRRARLRLRK